MVYKIIIASNFNAGKICSLVKALLYELNWIKVDVNSHTLVTATRGAFFLLYNCEFAITQFQDWTKSSEVCLSYRVVCPSLDLLSFKKKKF